MLKSCVTSVRRVLWCRSGVLGCGRGILGRECRMLRRRGRVLGSLRGVFWGRRGVFGSRRGVFRGRGGIFRLIGGILRLSLVLNVSHEALISLRLVGDRLDAAVRQSDPVAALGQVPVTCLLLAEVGAGVLVLYLVPVRVLGRYLLGRRQIQLGKRQAEHDTWS